jgi:acetyl esterase/lipase
VIEMKSFGGISANPFSPEAIAPETLGANAALVGALGSVGWTFPPQSLEALRNLPGPEPHYSTKAETVTVPTPNGSVDLRVIRSDNPTGIYLFCHPGGWTIGRADGNDTELERVIKATGMTAVSISYRLAPEHPYPAGLDDCENATRWVLDHSKEEFGSDRIVLGGSSAGANLALCTLLRVRGSANWHKVIGASLLYGNYDLTFTPSTRNAPPDKFLISTASLEWFYDQYVPDKSRRGDPDISPLYADLSGLPPVLLTAGTNDSLVDDTVFVALRMLASGTPCELQLVPGGEHAFDMLPIPSSQEAIERIDAFLADRVGAGSPATVA